MLDMYGQPHQTQPQPAHSSLSQQYHFQQSSASRSSSNNKKLKVDHVFQQQQAVDLCSLSSFNSTTNWVHLTRSASTKSRARQVVVAALQVPVVAVME